MFTDVEFEKFGMIRIYFEKFGVMGIRFDRSVEWNGITFWA